MDMQSGDHFSSRSLTSVQATSAYTSVQASGDRVIGFWNNHWFCLSVQSVAGYYDQRHPKS